MTEKWLHQPGDMNEKSIAKLLEKKPDATIKDIISGVPSQELSEQDYIQIKKERDDLVLHIIDLHVRLDTLKQQTPKLHESDKIRNHYKNEVTHLQERSVILNNRLTEIETMLSTRK